MNRGMRRRRGGRVMVAAQEFVLVIALGSMAIGQAAAQYIDLPVAPGVALPPPPPPPPPPKIEVPPIPKLGETAPTPKAALQNRDSFGDRVARCMGEAAAQGIPAAERSAYARACANQ